MAVELKKLVDQAKNSTDWLTRRRAIIQLSHQKDASLFKVFSNGLGDPVSEVRHASIIALTRLGDRSAVPLISKPRYLQSPDPQIRWISVRALGKLGDHRTIDLLVPLVDDEEWLVRNEAVSALQNRVADIVEKADPALARILIRMLTLEVPSLCDMAVDGLARMEDKCRPLLFEALKSIKMPVRKHALQVLIRAKDWRALNQIYPLLDDEEPAVRAEAIKALGSIGDQRAIPHLLEKLNDYNDTVHDALVNALVQFGAGIVDSLHTELTHHKDKRSLGTIIRALGKIKDRSSLPHLIANLNSAFYSIRRDTMEALAEFGDEIIPLLLKVLVYNDSDISALVEQAKRGGQENRVRAIRALGDLEDHRAIDLLKQLVLDRDPLIASTASDSLVKVGCAAWGRCGALHVIGMVGDESVATQLIPSLADDSPHVRYDAVRAIARLKSKKVIPELEKIAASDPVPEVRSEALRTLRELEPASKSLYQLALDSIYDDNTTVRLVATRILGDFVDESTLKYFFEKLTDPSWSIRLSAENALINFGASIVPELIEHLQTVPAEGSCRIISALTRIGDQKAVEAIENFQQNVKGKNERLESIARQALAILKGETGKKAVDLSMPLC